MICNLCQSIHFKPWQKLTKDEKLVILQCSDEFEEDPDDEALNEDTDSGHLLYYIHHPNLASLQKSADDGCQFCYQIRFGALEDAPLTNYDKHSSEQIFLQLNKDQINPPQHEQSYRGALRVVLGTKYWGEIILRKITGDFLNHTQLSKSLDSNMTTGSQTNINLASKWLSDCLNDHTNCSVQYPALSPLPLRVLDIGSLNTPRISLSVGEGRRGSYATLSYCWGNLPQHVTTKDNINARTEHIDASILPKTFSDTIFVCRILGIQFLWIDSMCIIQDDADDWNNQSEKMADIYAQGILNISAAVGIDSNGGLFVDRDPRKSYPCPFRGRYTDEDGSDITTSFLSCLEIDRKKYSYLDTRGWTFQEMYLPPRTLRFSASGIYWICASQNASESLPTGIRPLGHKSDFDKYIGRGLYGFDSSNADALQKYEWWYRAVEKYSRRHLGRESDRIKALSGLATLFGRGLHDEYLFGIWKLDIVRGLAWSIGKDVGDNAAESAQNNYFLQLAPSWSWASRPGKAINYFSLAGELEISSEFESSMDIKDTSPPPRPCFDFLSVDCTQNGTPPDLVASGVLKIRGLVLRARYSRKYGKDIITIFRPIADAHVYTSWGRPKYDEQVSEDDELYCLPISLERGANWLTDEENEARLLRETYKLGSNEELVSLQKGLLEYELMLSGVTWCGDEVPNMKLEGNRTYNCLILKKIGTEKIRFRRVGYVGILDEYCFEELVPNTLEIE